MMNKLQVIFVTLISIYIGLATAGVPLQRFEALMSQQSEDLGLYNSSDKVIKLTDVNFNETVLDQSHSSLVEFYNTYCGHCKRFAPTYKKLAEQLHPWQNVLIVGAIDCAAEENNGLCRQYEIMGYPTLRYMGPGFQPTLTQLGININTQITEDIRKQLANLLIAENRTAINNVYWPNFQFLTENDNAKNLFEAAGSQRKFIAIIYEAENSTEAADAALQLTRWPSIEVRRVNDINIAAKFKINPTRSKLAIVEKAGNNIKSFETTATDDNAKYYVETIESFLHSQHLTHLPDSAAPVTVTVEMSQVNYAEEAQIKAIVEEVHRNKHAVYQADLELAIRSMLLNEIPKIGEIKGERLLALQRLLKVLTLYNPLGPSGRQLISKLNEFVVQFNQRLTGKEFEVELKRLKKKFGPIFSANHYIGCSGSRHALRGFTCSLWQLFHFMSVQATYNEVVQDPLEVLQAIHGYVTYFFGCTNCAEHFQAMATRRKIWNVTNKDDAVLWLWAAHNEVNQRLAGDATEDPEFPKIQFPSQLSCNECYKQPDVSPVSLDNNWNKDKVLVFLKNIHHPENISRYGIQREELLHPSLDKIRQKRQLGKVFSDMDMRMGMLLYGFCIVMMVIAFKLFVFKGYRKKPYGHDMLGKV